MTVNRVEKCGAWVLRREIGRGAEDANVKKISSYITKKVAEKLEEISKNNAEEFSQKWDNLKLFIEYGMLTDEKFAEKAMKFALLKGADGKYSKIEEYTKSVADNQKDKDGKTVCLYCTDPVQQYRYVEAAKEKGYDVLVMDCPLDAHFVGLLESKLKDTLFKRVDSDSVDRLILKAETAKYEISDDDRKKVQAVFEEILPKDAKYEVSVENLGADAAPILITQSEFMRRYRDMAAVGGGMNFYGKNAGKQHPRNQKDQEDRTEYLKKHTDSAACDIDREVRRSEHEEFLFLSAVPVWSELTRRL